MTDAQEVAAAYMRAGKIVIADPEFKGLLAETIQAAISSENLETIYLGVVPLLLQNPNFIPIINNAIGIVLHQFAERIERLVLGKAAAGLLTNQQAARMMNISARTLSNMRNQGQGPKWSGSGKWVRYEPVDVIDWFRSLPKNSDGPG